MVTHTLIKVRLFKYLPRANYQKNSGGSRRIRVYELSIHAINFNQIDVNKSISILERMVIKDHVDAILKDQFTSFL